LWTVCSNRDYLADLLCREAIERNIVVDWSEAHSIRTYDHFKRVFLYRSNAEVEQLLSPYRESFSRKPNFWLSWSEVAGISEQELFTIGSHSVSHNNLTLLSDDEVARELSTSKIL